MRKNTKLGRIAVIVPLYKESLTASEEFSFRNTLAVLCNHDIYVICPKRLTDYLLILKKETGLFFNIEFFSDSFFADVSGYNRLMMSVEFYRRFNLYEYIIIVQTDALVISDQVETWCQRGYSYIGAPWFDGLDKPTKPLTFLGVGNGGFSLRKVQDFLRVLSYPRYLPFKFIKDNYNSSFFYRFIKFIRYRFIFSYSDYFLGPKINEDFFWGLVVPKKCKFFLVPEPEEAISFAFEVLPEYLFELNGHELPFGCHAWEKYNFSFWRDIFSTRGIDIP